MKTLTELSGTLIRKAAAAIAEARRSLPTSPTSEAPAVAEASPEGPAVTEAPAPAVPAPEAQAEVSPATPAEASPAAPTPPASPAPRKGPPVEQPETEAVKEALDAAVAAATGLSGDRLARLRDAVKVAGRQVEDVRLVRVFGPEEPVAGAKSLNGFLYLVDLAPASMRQDSAPKKERFGRGGGDRGRGGSGKGAPASGGFSMDSLREDRKGQRGGPRGGSGGRGKPGGGAR